MTSHTSFLVKCRAFPSSISPFLFLLIESSIISTNQIPQVEGGVEPGEATTAEVPAEPVTEVCCSPSQHASLSVFTLCSQIRGEMSD